MTKVTILGSGAAPGVPSIVSGWGKCNPLNCKNRRQRTGAYVECVNSQNEMVHFLIDTSPDIRCQLLDNDICAVDAVLYTHAHADHLHGIDDLRSLNRLTQKPIDIYANAYTAGIIRQRFDYAVYEKSHAEENIYRPQLILNEIASGNPFQIKQIDIVPIDLIGHAVQSTGYIINDGEIVWIADCKEIPDESLKLIKKQPKLLVMPLTTIVPLSYHMGLDKLLEYVKIIQPQQTIVNHMATECDYDEINRLTPENVAPAYDNQVIEI